jgi:hypothetical protein
MGTSTLQHVDSTAGEAAPKLQKLDPRRRAPIAPKIATARNPSATWTPLSAHKSVYAQGRRPSPTTPLPTRTNTTNASHIRTSDSDRFSGVHILNSDARAKKEIRAVSECWRTALMFLQPQHKINR